MQPKIKAKARCEDGEAGSISKVIVDPLSLEISHVVVREGDGQGVDRQVPIGQVLEIPNEEEIVLRGSLEEFRTFPVLDRDAYVTHHDVEIAHLEDRLHVELSLIHISEPTRPY